MALSLGIRRPQPLRAYLKVHIFLPVLSTACIPMYLVLLSVLVFFFCGQTRNMTGTPLLYLPRVIRLSDLLMPRPSKKYQAIPRNSLIVFIGMAILNSFYLLGSFFLGYCTASVPLSASIPPVLRLARRVLVSNLHIY